MWLAELLAHGLIGRASYRTHADPGDAQPAARTRKQLVREQSSHVLRVQEKTLEDANIKLDAQCSPDLMGKSVGRAMIEALIAGETNPAKLAALADRRVKASHEEFREALRGLPRDEAPSLPAAPSSESDRCSRCSYGHARHASGGEPWALSHRSRVNQCRSRASRTSAPTSSSPRSEST